MKRRRNVLFELIAGVCLLIVSTTAMSQEEEESPFSVGMDLYNRYVWRGTDFGNSPSFQPYLEYSIAGFTVGAWGAYPFTVMDASGFDYEADVYASYTYNDMIGITFTDYFIPLTGQSYNYFDYSDPNDTTITSHGFEISLGFNGLENLPLSITVAQFIGGFDNKSFYAELGYSFSSFDVFVGAGNEVYTVEDEDESDSFNIVNVGISISKELRISDTYALPVSGSIIVNPDAEAIYFVAGLSF